MTSAVFFAPTGGRWESRFDRPHCNEKEMSSVFVGTPTRQNLEEANSGNTPIPKCTNCEIEKEVMFACPCFQARYCSTECQLAHWSVHKNRCGHSRKERQLLLRSCFHCSEKSYALRQCPCGHALYCGRGCQIADWERHRNVCVTTENLRRRISNYPHMVRNVDVAVQTEGDYSDRNTNRDNRSPRRTAAIHFVPHERCNLDTDTGRNNGMEHNTQIATNGIGVTATSSARRVQDHMHTSSMNIPDVSVYSLHKPPLSLSIIDFDRVDCESESSTLEGASANGASLTGPTREKNGAASTNSNNNINNSVSHSGRPPIMRQALQTQSGVNRNIPHHPLDSIVENPLITVPIRTTFDTLPGLASYLASQNKDSGIVVVAASFKNFVAEETALRREISVNQKKNRVELMRRFTLGKVKIAFTEINAEEKRDRKEIMTDNILWWRKLIYPEYKLFKKKMSILY